jgi:hypothetical protein
VKPLLDAKDLQAEYGVSRHAAYELLHRLGVYVTERRVVVLRSRLEAHLGGGVAMADTPAGNGRGPHRSAPAEASD